MSSQYSASTERGFKVRFRNLLSLHCEGICRQEIFLPLLNSCPGESKKERHFVTKFTGAPQKGGKQLYVMGNLAKLRCEGRIFDLPIATHSP